MSKLIIKATQALTGGRKLFVGGRKQAPYIAKKPELVGEMVWIRENEYAGRVIEKYSNGMCVVQVAVPDGKGMLVLTDTHESVPTNDVHPSRLVVAEGKAKEWNLFEEFSDTKMVEVKNGDVVVDYKDVFVEGLASTFANVTPADRDGDVVASNAFDETLNQFRKNPVMLIDHRNSVLNIAGSFDKIGVSNTGLMVRGRVSNAPDLARVRFLIVEKHLRAFSMGGMFFYGPDGKTINKVELFEVSLVGVPANQDALFSVRAPSLDGAMKMFKKYAAGEGGGKKAA